MKRRYVAVFMAVAFAVGIGIGMIGTEGNSSTQVQVSTPPVAHTVHTSMPTLSAKATPDGAYQGACDYTLSDSINAQYPATATGDITVTNTGNVGIVVNATITWPQQGYSPLSMTKTVRVATGSNDDVQFHMNLSQDQISNLQNWQAGHNFQDGCTYTGKIVSTFGTPR